MIYVVQFVLSTKRDEFASDNKSLINKMVDFTSNTLDVFIIGDICAEKVEALKKAILSKARKS